MSKQGPYLYIDRLSTMGRHLLYSKRCAPASCYSPKARLSQEQRYPGNIRRTINRSRPVYTLNVLATCPGLIDASLGLRPMAANNPVEPEER